MALFLTELGHGIKIRNAARGVETSGGGWQGAGVGNVQVYNVPRQERRWGEGDKKIGDATTNATYGGG